ncbi:MAG: hypothetical protein V7K21_17030 [Nostoc sp.]
MSLIMGHWGATAVSVAVASNRASRVSRLVPLRGSKLARASPLKEATGVIGHKR